MTLMPEIFQRKLDGDERQKFAGYQPEPCKDLPDSLSMDPTKMHPPRSGSGVRKKQ